MDKRHLQYNTLAATYITNRRVVQRLYSVQNVKEEELYSQHGWVMNEVNANGHAPLLSTRDAADLHRIKPALSTKGGFEKRCFTKAKKTTLLEYCAFWQAPVLITIP
jgi:hypothetical protein